jgi:hypothetical protein
MESAKFPDCSWSNVSGGGSLFDMALIQELLFSPCCSSQTRELSAGALSRDLFVFQRKEVRL